MSDSLEDLARANKLVSWHLIFCGRYRPHERLTRSNLVINRKTALSSADYFATAVDFADEVTDYFGCGA